MTKNGERLFVITGGPGSGGSALIEALKQAGYATSVEAGRGIIQDQVVIGGSALPWSDPILFAETMLCWEMRSYHIARDERGPVFFDRGVPDVLGYLTLMRLPVPEYMQRAADIFRYNRRAFVAPPWAEIFQQDRERKQNFDEAKRTHHAMVASYTDLGYQLVEIPRASVDARVRFILHHVGLASAG